MLGLRAVTTNRRMYGEQGDTNLTTYPCVVRRLRMRVASHSLICLQGLMRYRRGDSGGIILQCWACVFNFNKSMAIILQGIGGGGGGGGI